MVPVESRLGLVGGGELTGLRRVGLGLWTKVLTIIGGLTIAEVVYSAEVPILDGLACSSSCMGRMGSLTAGAENVSASRLGTTLSGVVGSE